eukprot:GHVU01184784.1.p2 GENE.GHVU01184784.1~~GHVU01184784.1.p2  ORF type:complete len:125 (-),score=33.37 GHVU01184784.1:362-736(-)
MAAGKLTSKAGPVKVKTVNYTINCKTVTDAKAIQTKKMEQFLKEKIKVDGRVNKYSAEQLSFKSSPSDIHVAVSVQMRKRYLKYLVKKYLKAIGVRDFIRVLARGPHVYELRFFDIDEKDKEKA